MRTVDKYDRNSTVINGDAYLWHDNTNIFNNKRNKQENEIMLNKLKDILDFIDYGYSEIYSAGDVLPDYDANSSSRDYISQAESYLDEARDGLEENIVKLEKKND